MKGGIVRCLVCCLVACSVLMLMDYPAAAAEKEKDQKIPVTQYWMDIATMNQSIPGMSGANSPTSGLMGKMMGARGFGPKRSMSLRLNSPNELPPEPVADHPAWIKNGGCLAAPYTAAGKGKI